MQEQGNYESTERQLPEWDHRRRDRGNCGTRGHEFVGHPPYHHVSKHHLRRYLSEFDFRYNAHKIDDGERPILTVKGTTGKRLKYRD
jgi:hypothetical protein